MISTALLTGGAVYVSYQAYRAAQPEAAGGWWQGVAGWLQKWRAEVWGKARPLNSRQAFDRPQRPGPDQVAAAATALGAATTALYYPPARLLCMPAFLYLGARASQRGYQYWRQEQGITPAVVEGVVVVFCLVQGYLVVGALGLTCYYLGQMVADAGEPPQSLPDGWQFPRWAWRQSPTGEVATAVGRLQIGDCMVVRSGEMVPLTGVITQGSAWVRRPGEMLAVVDDPCSLGIKVVAGEFVEAATIVLLGTLNVTVTAASAVC